MRWTPERIVFVGLGLALVLLVITGIASQSFLAHANDVAESVRKSDRTVLGLERVLSSVKDAESGQRGFLLTGDATYLEPYESGRKAARSELERILSRTAETEIPMIEILAVRSVVEHKLDEMAHTVELRKNGATEEAIAVVKSGVGQKAMDQIRAAIAALDDGATARRRMQIAAGDDARRNAVYENVARSAALFVFLCGFGALILRHLKFQRRAEASLAEQREWLATTLLSIGDGVIATDARGRIVLMNAVAERLTGWTSSEVAGRAHTDVFNVVNEATRKTVESPIERVLRDGVIVGLANHTLLIRRDGTSFAIDDSGAPIRGTNGEIAGAVLVFRDVSDRARADAELRARERFNASVIESSSDVIKVLDAQGHVLSLNRAGLALLEIDDASVVRGRPWRDLWDGEAPKADQALADARQGRQGRFQGARRTARGTLKSWDVIVTPVLDDAGKPANFVCVSRDITDLLRAQRSVREKETELETLFHQVTAGIARTDLTGRFTLVNERFCQILGRKREDVLESRVHDVIHPDDLARTSPLLERATAGGAGFVIEKRYVRPDGSHVWVNGSVDPIRDDAGRVFALVTVVEDVTDRKRAEEDRERLAAVVENSVDFIGLFDLNARPIFVNAAGKALVGIAESGESSEIGIAEYFHPDDRARLESEILAAVRGRGRWSGELRFQSRAAKGEIPVMSDVFRVDDPHTSAPIGYALVSRDIRERKRAESERDALLAAERTARSEAERVGRVKDEFVATLSHELRTPLNAILGWAQVLRLGNSPPEDLQSGLETIERNARVQSQLIEDLLDMSRIVSGKIRLDVQRVDMPKIIQGAIDVVRPAAEGKGVRLHSVIDPRTNLVQGDPTRLQQIVWNLLSNAVKFTPKGGRVEVIVRRVNSHIEIVVSDTGKGIRADFLPHVFERFRQEDSSTTREFRGVGLGLAIARHLIELHGGSIRVASDGEGKGATFTVELPLTLVKSAQETSERAHPLSPTAIRLDHVAVDLRGVKVLAVDDERDSRELMQRILRDSHAEVMVAASVDEALERFSAFRPDVVISDIGMPERDGYELIRSVRSLAASEGGTTPAAALTALARSEDRTRTLLAGYQVHVAKPIEPSELLAVVASLAGVSSRARERRGDGRSEPAS